MRSLSGDTLQKLRFLRTNLGDQKLSELLEVSPRTLTRWNAEDTSPPKYIAAALENIEQSLPNQQCAQETRKTFRFIDLFAGIGGTRLGMEAAGGHCVFTSEWDKFSQKTYSANFGHVFPQEPSPGVIKTSEDHFFAGDITQVNATDIPDHDILVGGFPCQPFSIAGVSKKNSLGRQHGFLDETQGTLFFDIARILEEKKPQAFLLENVKNLLSHDRGRTFKVISKTLQGLGYSITYRVLSASPYVPQNRSRIFIVGFRDVNKFIGMDAFNFDDIPQLNTTPDIQGPTMSSVLHTEDGSEIAELPYTEGPKASVSEKYTLTPKLWSYLQNYAAKHRTAGNGFGYGLVDASSVARTLSARYYKDGSEILVSRGEGKRPRRLTPREAGRLMGFPNDFVIPVSDVQAYKQFGNSVVVPLVSDISKNLAHTLVNG